MIIINKETNKTYVFEEPNKIAYDGCHKIYICEDDEDLKEATEIGYQIHNIDELETLFNQSCLLVFIHNWKLTTTPVGQFEGAKFIH